jgi:hypothetical protein
VTLSRRTAVSGGLASSLAVVCPRLLFSAGLGELSFTDCQRWRSDRFTAAWSDPGGGGGGILSKRYLADPGMVFGVEPSGVSALFEGGVVPSVTLVVLDAGDFFARAGKRLAGKSAGEVRSAFDRAFVRELDAVGGGLLRSAGGKEPESVAVMCGNGRTVDVALYRLPNAFARLLTFAGQLIALDVFPGRETASTFVADAMRAMGRKERRVFFSGEVESSAGGDTHLPGIPLILQGNRAYCGMSALAMAGQYLGFGAGVEELAAVAGFTYGSPQDGRVREIFSDVADALGIRASRGTAFTFKRARRSIEAGFPVVVFRRWSRERDYLHSMVSRRRRRGDAHVRLPAPGLADRDSWPGKDAPGHASVIHGFNWREKEVIFSESWAASAMNRRMRIEEMEATSYYVVYFSP